MLLNIYILLFPNLVLSHIPIRRNLLQRNSTVPSRVDVVNT